LRPAWSGKADPSRRGVRRQKTTESVDPTGTSTRTYDRAGSTTAFTQPNPGGSPYEYLYSYDLEGRPRTLTYADGGRARFSHDDQGRLELVETETAPDTWTDTAEYSWDDDGDPTAAALGGTHGTRAWAYPANDAHQPESYAQDIDPDGTDNEADNGGGGTDADLTTTLEWGYDGRLAAETTAGEDTGYTYDPAGQLLEADSETADDHVYAYGPSGERLTRTAGGDATDYTYNSSGELTATDTTGTSADVAYTYDGDGRRTEADTGTGAEVTTYLYDPRGLLAEVEEDDGTAETTARAYDGDGRLTLIDPDTGPSTEITWDPTQAVPEMLELYTSADDWTRYTYGTDRTASQPFTDGDPDSDPVAFPYDHRGSAISDGAEVAAPDPYDPYGTPDAAPSDLEPGYRGEHHTGDLIHLRNRDYDPTTGTFTTPDPLDGVDATPTVGNPYHYADNDPFNRVDPLGLRSSDQCGLSGGPGQGWGRAAQVPPPTPVAPPGAPPVMAPWPSPWMNGDGTTAERIEDVIDDLFGGEAQKQAFPCTDSDKYQGDPTQSEEYDGSPVIWRAGSSSLLNLTPRPRIDVEGYPNNGLSTYTTLVDACAGTAKKAQRIVVDLLGQVEGLQLAPDSNNPRHIFLRADTEEAHEQWAATRERADELRHRLSVGIEAAIRGSVPCAGI
jgi:RHS repeat-associated protein